MSEICTIQLGERTFDVPPLPLRLNMIAYPLCQKLAAGGLVDRFVANKGTLICSMDEMTDLATVAFMFARAADREIDQASFDEMHIPPQDLIIAYITGRVQTGGWVKRSASEENNAPGEATGEQSPQT